MILEFLILLLVLKYREDIRDLFRSEEYEIPKYAGLDYKYRKRLRLVVDN